MIEWYFYAVFAAYPVIGFMTGVNGLLCSVCRNGYLFIIEQENNLEHFVPFGEECNEVDYIKEIFEVASIVY